MEQPGDARGDRLDEAGYLRERVDDQIGWYDRTSCACKRRHLLLQTLTLVVAAAIPVTTLVMGTWAGRVAVAILGAVTAVAAGLAALLQLREHWIEYRTTAEALKHEKFLFLTRAGAYADAGAFPRFVGAVEGLVSRQHASWQRRQARETVAKDPAAPATAAAGTPEAG